MGDIGVNPLRKGWNVLAELFAPYSAADYRGLFVNEEPVGNRVTVEVDDECRQALIQPQTSAEVAAFSACGDARLLSRPICSSQLSGMLRGLLLYCSQRPPCTADGLRA